MLSHSFKSTWQESYPVKSTCTVDSILNPCVCMKYRNSFFCFLPIYIQSDIYRWQKSPEGCPLGSRVVHNHHCYGCRGWILKATLLCCKMAWKQQWTWYNDSQYNLYATTLLIMTVSITCLVGTDVLSHTVSVLLCRLVATVKDAEE